MMKPNTDIKRKYYKIQVIGGNKKAGKPSQFYVAVPMEWARLHGLGKGDVLEAAYTTSKNDSSLLIKIP